MEMLAPFRRYKYWGGVKKLLHMVKHQPNSCDWFGKTSKCKALGHIWSVPFKLMVKTQGWEKALFWMIWQWTVWGRSHFWHFAFIPVSGDGVDGTSTPSSTASHIHQWTCWISEDHQLFLSSWRKGSTNSLLRPMAGATDLNGVWSPLVWLPWPRELIIFHRVVVARIICIIEECPWTSLFWIFMHN